MGLPLTANRYEALMSPGWAGRAVWQWQSWESLALRTSLALQFSFYILPSELHIFFVRCLCVCLPNYLGLGLGLPHLDVALRIWQCGFPPIPVWMSDCVYPCAISPSVCAHSLRAASRVPFRPSVLHLLYVFNFPVLFPVLRFPSRI